MLASAFVFLVGWRYYELGPEDPPYAAKFYDCCGAEDPEASGCTTSFHVSYDDWCNVSLHHLDFDWIKSEYIYACFIIIGCL